MHFVLGGIGVSNKSLTFLLRESYQILVEDSGKFNARRGVMPLTLLANPIQINVMKCLGGVCRADRQKIHELQRLRTILKVHEADKSNQTSDFETYILINEKYDEEFSNDSFVYDANDYNHDIPNDLNIVSAFCDSLAVILSRVFQIDNPLDNMRYDPQIAPFFRASVISLLILFLGIAFYLISLIIQCMLIICRFQCVRKRFLFMWENIRNVLCAFGGLFLILSPMLFFSATFYSSLIVKNASYTPGFIIIIVVTFLLNLFDTYKEKLAPRKDKRVDDTMNISDSIMNINDATDGSTICPVSTTL